MADDAFLVFLGGRNRNQFRHVMAPAREVIKPLLRYLLSLTSATMTVTTLSIIIITETLSDWVIGKRLVSEPLFVRVHSMD